MNVITDLLKDSVYTSCYCEENVYCFLKSLPISIQSNSFTLFISNSARVNLLFQQKASRYPQKGSFVHWDYHCIALVALEEQKKVMIVDQDSLLGDVVDLEKYIRETFKSELFEHSKDVLSTPFKRQRSRCRMIPALDFLSNFASDRSHMLKDKRILLVENLPSPLPDDFYIRPPPSYPPIQGSLAKQRGENNNLFDRFLDMRLDGEREEDGVGKEAEGFGKVLETMEELVLLF